MFSAQLYFKIKTLVSSLQKKSYSQTLTEINTTLEMYHENDRIAVMSSLLDDIDFRGEPKPKDEAKCILLGEEFVNCLKKSNCVSQLCSSFEGGSRQKLIMQNQKLPDEFLINVCNTLKLRASTAVSIAFCLCKSQVRSFVIDSLKIIRARVSELNSNAAISDMSEEIILGLIQLVRSQEELALPEVSGPFLSLIKANYTQYGSVMGSASRNKLSNNDGFDRDLGQIQKHSESSRQKMSIASILEEYGAHCSTTLDMFRKALFGIGLKLDEEQVAAIIIMILPRSVTADHEEKKEQWNLEVVAEVLNVECRGFNWINVVKYLDNPNLQIRCEADYQLLTRLFVRISGASFPVLGLLSSTWNNRPAYLAILTLAANSPRNIMDFSSLVSPDQLMQGDIATPANLSWLCLPLYARFFDLASSGMPNEVLDILSKAAGSYPEYFLVCLAQVQDPTSGVRSELLRRLLPSFTGLQGSRPTSLTVMRKLHSSNPDLLILLCRFALKKAKKVWEIANIDTLLRSLGSPIIRRLEDEGTVDELLGYWCYRADRNELNLEEKAIFLLDQNPKNARVFVSFAKVHAEMLRPRGMNSDGILSFESFAVLLRSVQAFPTIVSIDEVRALAAIFSQHQQNLQMQQQQQHHQQQQHQQMFSQGGHGGMNESDYGNTGGDTNELTRMPPGPDSDEIEALANSYFQKIYTSEIAINDVIVLLRQFKSSTEKREQEIFRCMIHNLFDEYRFFHKYPEKELQVTGRLFGALVQHQLVSSITLGIALRYVLEALRKDPEQGEGNDKMFRFGRVSLEQFRSRLSEWPQYCSHLIQIPHLMRHCPDLYQEAQKALATPQQLQQQAQQAAVQQQQLPPPPPMSGLQSMLSAADHVPTGSGSLYASSQISHSDLNLSGLTHNFSGMNLASVENNPIYSQSYMPNMQNAFANEIPAQPVTHRQMPSLSVASVPSVTMSPAPIVSNETFSAPESIVQSLVQEPIIEKPPRANNEIARMAAVNGDVLNTTMPPESIRDQIHFIINNIAKNNIEAKTLEIKEILKVDHFNWFANYLVVKRISTQPNLHPLYLNVLDALDMTALVKLVLDSAYHNVTKLLQSPNITTSSSERSLLRNLGVWLGQMTLARNKPLLQKRINLKELLFWGFETGRLIAVCSFVAKIVEGVKDSKVFRPPNPWLMAILGIMRELYEIEDLKLNIKFEVQVLCKNINIKIDDIPKGSELMTRCRMPTKDSRNPDFNPNRNASTPAGSSASPVTVQPIAAPSPLVPMSLPSPSVSTVAAPQEEEDLKAVPTGPVESRPISDLIQSVLQGLPASVVVSSSLAYFTTNPTQRRVVLVAVERGIREIIQSAVERSVTIAVNTTKSLILKDFATEPSEQNLRSGAHFMVTTLAGSLATATSKEPLRISIGNQLRTLLAQSISDQTVIEQIVQVCSNENVDMGTSLIEKVAVEKSAQDIDEALLSAYQARRKAREMNQQFADTAALQTTGKYPAELSDALKPRMGGLQPIQLQVYEGFNKLKIAAVGQSPSATGIASTGVVDGKSLPPPSNLPTLNMSQALEACQVFLVRIDTALKNVQAQTQGRADVALSMLGSDHEIMGILRELVLVLQRTQANLRVETATTFAEIAFNRMFDTITSSDSLRLEVFVSVLEALRDTCGAGKFTPDLIAWLSKYAGLVNNDETNRKLFRFVLILMLRAKLLRAADVDVYFVMYIDSGRNLFWLELALSFIRQCLVENLSTIYEFSNTFETVTKMRPTNMVLKKQLQKWLTDIKTLTTAQEEQKLVAPTTPAAGSATPTNTPVTPVTAATSTPADPRDAAVREHVAVLLDRWLRVWNSVNDQVFAQYLQLMHQYGVLKTEEAADRFFRIATEICSEACLKSASAPAAGSNEISTVNYAVIDALSKLFLLLVRLADKEASDMNVRVNLLSRILNAIARTVIEDHESKKVTKQPFDQRPFFRLFSNLSQDLGVADPKQDPNASIFGLLTAYTQVYLALNPAAVPGFAYGWVQLISRRSFMPHLLLAKGQKGWPYMHRLLSALLLFLQPFLKASQLIEPIKKLYKGTLRVLLVLLHDFPEFLCDFHLSFCDLIPMNCVQLRNLILSAFPRSMRLPDPFTPNLKLETLPECSQSPRILTDYLAPINGIRSHLDSFMATRQPAELPSKLPSILLNATGAYNVPLITSLIVYVGSVAIQQSTNKSQINSNCMEIYKQLSQALDAEGRYIVFNTMANQMRYPNSHTAFFSNVLLTLFQDAESEYLQEQITRVLLERLIVHRPHPWGLLITFIELIKNPKYAFWKKGFTRSAPEIEKVFESIARSCIGQNAAMVIQQQLDSS